MGLFKLLPSARYLRKRLSNVGIVHRTCCNTPEEGKKEEKPEEKQLDGNKMGLVLGVYEEKDKFELTAAAAEVDQKSGGKICKHLNELSCQMKLGKAFTVTDVLPEYSVIALCSLGPKDPGYNSLEELDVTRENVRWAVGAGVRALARRGCARVLVEPAGAPDAAAEAAELAAWRFEGFKSGQSPAPQVAALGAAGPQWAAGAVRGRAQNWARHLSDMPANKMVPVDLAQAAVDTLCPLGVRVEVRGRAWLEAQHMHATLAVARGSCEEPVLVECAYDGAGPGSANGDSGGPGQHPPVLLVGKGVTFDSGGLCLKEPAAMMESRGSMAGAAVVFAALKVLAELKVPINVRAVVPMCENMVSGQCMKLGDVVRAPNGLSIQIEDTDMEGGLLLADALAYGQAAHRPALVVDVATFSHGVLLATGGGAFGCFSNSEPAWAAMRAAGALSGDRPWRFPLWTYYRDQVSNDPAVDLRNKGSGKATACLGAAFLRNFIRGPWLHLDITGVGKLAHAPAPPYLDPRRMTGRPLRALAALLQGAATPQQQRRPQPPGEHRPAPHEAAAAGTA